MTKIAVGTENYLIASPNAQELIKELKNLPEYNVRFLNLRDPYNSQGYNPLFYIDDERQVYDFINCFYSKNEQSANIEASRSLFAVLAAWFADINEVTLEDENNEKDENFAEKNLMWLSVFLHCDAEKNTKEDCERIDTLLRATLNTYQPKNHYFNIEKLLQNYISKSFDDRIAGMQDLRTRLRQFLCCDKIVMDDQMDLIALHSVKTVVVVYLPRELDYASAVLYNLILKQISYFKFANPEEMLDDETKNMVFEDATETLIRLENHLTLKQYINSKTYKKYNASTKTQAEAYFVKCVVTNVRQYLAIMYNIENSDLYPKHSAVSKKDLTEMFYGFACTTLESPVSFLFLVTGLVKKIAEFKNEDPDNLLYLPGYSFLRELTEDASFLSKNVKCDMNMAKTIFNEYLNECNFMPTTKYEDQTALRQLIESMNSAREISENDENDEESEYNAHELFMVSEYENTYAKEFISSQTYKDIEKNKKNKDLLKQLAISVFLAGSSSVSIFANTFNHEHWVKDFEIKSKDEERIKTMQYIWLAINKPRVLANQLNHYINELCDTNKLTVKDISTRQEFNIISNTTSLITTILSYTKFKDELNTIFNEYIKELDLKIDFNADFYDKTYENGEISEPKEEVYQKKIEEFVKEWTPAKIKEYLDEYIIGQDEAKKTISIAFWEHFYKILHPECEFKKENVLLIGPSGSGKTEIMRTLDRISPIKITIFDASGMSQDAWKGDKKISSIIPQAINTIALSDDDLESDEALDLAQKSIIFLDEIDKLIRPQYTSHNENVSVSLQGELLKLLEDGDFNIELSLNSGDTATVTVSSKNILFVCAGAFEDLHSKTEEDNNFRKIGFGPSPKTICNRKRYNYDDLIAYGMTPELAGRIPVTETLYALSEEDMVKIMTQVKDSSIKKFQLSLHDEFGYNITFADDSYAKIAKHVIGKMGARGIQSVLFDLKKKIIYSAPAGAKIKITDVDNFEIV